jgi:glutamine amidotransferase
MTTVLIDYDSGNLHSAEKAFQRMAAEGGHGPVIVTADPDQVARATRVVLPGDGAFPACRRGLAAIDGLEAAIIEAVEQRAVPFLGICVGMQMLASWGREYEDVAGFGWVQGEVARITPDDPGLKVPHMGWNDLVIDQPHPVLAGIETGDHAYFVHSYAMRVENPADLLAHVDYGGPVTAIVGRNNVVGTQFHPEKSQRAGLRLIANFLNWRP